MSPKIPSTFISYCHDDSEFALRLAEDLKAAGAAVWIDQIDIPFGERWDIEVERALMSSPRMLVILSPASVSSSNVLDEVSFALSKQKSVIPVLYQDCEVPFRLHRLQHVDFRNSYERGLKAITGVLIEPKQASGLEVEQKSQVVIPPDEAPLAHRLEEHAEPSAPETANGTDRLLIEQRLAAITEPDPIPSLPAVLEENSRNTDDRLSQPAMIDRVEDELLGKQNGEAPSEGVAASSSEADIPHQDAAGVVTNRAELELPPVRFSGEDVEPEAPAGNFTRAKINIIVGAVVLIVVLALTSWFFSTDWKSLTKGLPDDNTLQSVTFLTPRTGWAVGVLGRILHTEDGGATWQQQTSGTYLLDLNSVVFRTAQSGWSVGADGTILHTEDGGTTWKFQRSGPRESLESVAFPTPQSGWVVGTNGTILHTEDGGATWKSQAKVSSTENNLESVAFPTPQSGWAVGTNGAIVHTEDAGATWKSQASGTRESLESVAFPTPQSGWAVGTNGAIVHTEDAGATWKSQPSGTNLPLQSVAFPTPQSGWAVGWGGLILHTEDGGATWKPQRSGTKKWLQSVAFPTPQSGWAVGGNGIILHMK